MNDNTYNGYESYDHWNTALWLNNDEEFSNVLNNKVEEAVYMQCTRSQAIHEVRQQLPARTPDDAAWEIETIEDLFDERYSEQLQYS